MITNTAQAAAIANFNFLAASSLVFLSRLAVEFLRYPDIRVLRLRAEGSLFGIGNRSPIF